MSSLSRKSILLSATFILLVATALRVWQLGEWPPGLHYDEAADTIIAREIAEGRGAPIFVEAYTGKEVLFFYWAAAWMKLIGATPFAMRLAAAMLGMLTAAATFWAVREVFSPLSLKGRGAGGEGLALLATAFVATSFWHVLMSRLGLRSIAEPCVQAFALAALWRGLRLNHRRWLALGGGLVGLNLYTYLAARLFPVAVALLFLYLILFDAGRRRARLAQFGVVVVVAAVVFAPLGIFFAQNPGAFITRIAQVAPREGQDVLANIVHALGMFLAGGDPYVRFNLPGRSLFPSVLGVLFVAGAIISAIGVFRGRTLVRRAAYFFVLTSTPIMLLPTALAVNEITPSNLRAMGMIPMVFAFPALGTWFIFKWLIVITGVWRQPYLAIGVQASACEAPRYGSLKAALREFAKLQVIRPLRETMDEGRNIVARSGRAERSFAAVLLLVALLGAADMASTYAGYARLPELYYASDGDLVDIAGLLNRADLQQTTAYVHALHYRHPTLAALAQSFHEIRSITGPDVLVFPQGQSTHIFANLALPADRAWRERFLPPSARLDAAIGPDGRTAYEIVTVDAQPSIRPQNMVDANFGDTIRLLGYDVESRATSGGEIDVTLIWQVLNRPDRGDYATFAELRDAWGFQWGQAGSFDYPSEQWTPGEIIVQRLRVPIADGAPRGDYRLDAGWHAGDRRLPVVKAGGSFGGTTASLGPIPIARARREPSKGSLGMGARLGVHPIDGLFLLGSSLETPVAPQGGPLFFTLFWRVESHVPDQPVGIRMSAPGDVIYALSTASPVHDTYPFDEWRPGEVVADRYGLRVPVEALPGEYALEVRVRPGEWIPFGTVRVEEMQRRFDVPPIAHPAGATFGDQIELLGYDLSQTSEAIELTLYWRALKTPDDDYTVFTHLLDAAGVQRGGKDNPPVNGAYNTSLWIEGEVIEDTYTIPIPADTPPGEYTIQVGLYRFDTGERLPLSSGGDALRLATIEIAPR